MQLEMHWMDRKYLVGFNADPENQKLRAEYFKIKTIWHRPGNKGELPQATLLALAMKHQKPEPKPQEAEAEIKEKELQPA